MVLENDLRESVNTIVEGLSIDKLRSDTGVLLIIDSGVYMSTCPKAWCSWSSMLPLVNAPSAVTATGSPLTVYGA
eukprot:3697274-Heterocapsa_arctica.AAC.1